MRVIARRATMLAGDPSRGAISPASIVASLVISIFVVVTTFSQPLRCLSWQLVRPCLNCATQYFIVVNKGADSRRVEFSLSLILVVLGPFK